MSGPVVSDALVDLLWHPRSLTLLLAVILLHVLSRSRIILRYDGGRSKTQRRSANALHDVPARLEAPLADNGDHHHDTPRQPRTTTRRHPLSSAKGRRHARTK